MNSALIEHPGRQATLPATIRIPQLTEKLENLFHTRPETPVLAVDLQVVETKYRELRQFFPAAAPYYAVKANPAPEVVALLASLGASFDVASVPELEMCLGLGIAPSHISYG